MLLAWILHDFHAVLPAIVRALILGGFDYCVLVNASSHDVMVVVVPATAIGGGNVDFGWLIHLLPSLPVAGG